MNPLYIAIAYYERSVETTADHEDKYFTNYWYELLDPKHPQIPGWEYDADRQELLIEPDKHGNIQYGNSGIDYIPRTQIAMISCYNHAQQVVMDTADHSTCWTIHFPTDATMRSWLKENLS